VPEDETIFLPNNTTANPTDTSNAPSDIEDFAIFMRFLDQPTPSCTASGSAPTCSSSIQDGLTQFKAVDGLNDGITQGAAGPDQFRTAPLWGIGQRLFFLHDGRTSDLLVAIKAHASRGSEANAVIRNYNGLSPTQQQEVLRLLKATLGTIVTGLQRGRPRGLFRQSLSALRRTAGGHATAEGAGAVERGCELRGVTVDCG
jgi:di-heme oxidoreductase (putative peroxidase)